MSRLFIAPYKMGSESAKALANLLQCKRVDSTKIFKPRDLIVNWGNNGVENVRGNPKILNKIEAIAKATNKLSTLITLENSNVSKLTFITDTGQAQQLLREGKNLYARTILNGHGGKGIVYLSQENGLFVRAPLYTIAFPTDREYRVHVFQNKVLDIQQKRRRLETEVNNYIRNLDNGWIFSRENVTAPYKVYEQSIKAVKALGLDFGACDVLVDKDNNVVICEVNTAPGIEESTLHNYSKAIKEYYEFSTFHTR